MADEILTRLDHPTPNFPESIVCYTPSWSLVLAVPVWALCAVCCPFTDDTHGSGKAC